VAGLIRVLVADDEPAARRGIGLLLAADPEFTVVGETGDGVDTLQSILRLQPDLVFLDVQMPGFDGFEVLARLTPETSPLVVFVTAFDQYLLDAFGVHAADYLLKPFSDARFRAAAAHAKERVRQRRAGGVERARPEPDQTPPERIPIRTSRGTLLLPVEQVDWIEARGDYVRIHSAGRTDLVRDTIAAFERRLPPQRFVRVHRSAIVNLARVREVCALPTGEHVAVLQSGVCCRLSRSGRARFQRLVYEGLRPR
jgi:two-component system, LytTR family, response regulator